LVAEAIAKLVQEEDEWKMVGTFDLAGEEQYTLREIFDLVWDITEMSANVIDVHSSVAKVCFLY